MLKEEPEKKNDLRLNWYCRQCDHIWASQEQENKPDKNSLGLHDLEAKCQNFTHRSKIGKRIHWLLFFVCGMCILLAILSLKFFYFYIFCSAQHLLVFLMPKHYPLYIIVRPKATNKSGLPRRIRLIRIILSISSSLY